MSNDKQDLFYWRENAEQNYIGTNPNVLKYIQKLEEHLELEKSQSKAKQNFQFILGWAVGFGGILIGYFM